MKSPLHPPARLSYIGVPRRLPWGVSYGSLCFIAATAGWVTLDIAWASLILFVAGFAACYARFIGRRVHVAVWSRGAGDGYEVMTRVLGVTSRYLASRLPELEFSELSNAEAINKGSLRSSQLALRLRLGSSTVSLPSLHAGAGADDARARLAPLRAALQALGQLDGAPPVYAKGSHEGRAWKFPKVESTANIQIEGLRWADGDADKVMLRHGLTLPGYPLMRSVCTLFGVGLLLVAVSAALPSSQTPSARVYFAAGAATLALTAFVLTSWRERLRIERRAGPSQAAVVMEHRIFGASVSSTTVPIADGLRLLFVKQYQSDSEASGASIEANLVTRAGALHHLKAVGDEPEGHKEEADPARELLDSFGASLSNVSLMEEVLAEPLPSATRRVHPAQNPSYELPPLARPAPAFVLRSPLAPAAAILGAFVLLAALGAAIADLVDLSHTTAWVQTTYYSENVRRGKYNDLVARPSIDPRVRLIPRPPLTEAFSGYKCWVLDHPRGHDVVRYTEPSGPPTLRDEFRLSTLAMLGACLLFAFVAAGPWLRARRAFQVYAG